MRITAPFSLFFLGCCLVGAILQGQDLKFAALGDFKLQNGEPIRDCRIGYRTFGKLNAAKSNAILMTAFASGTSEHLKETITHSEYIDLSKDFVVAIDPIGNGVSSSPSNSPLQSRMQFPKYGIRDMVESQHELLTKVLGIQHLRVVMGVSMGGMQTLQWMVAYPDFMDKAVAISGSPRLAPYDLLHMRTQIDAITTDPAWNQGEYITNPARVAEAEFGALLLTTPEYFNKHTTREQVFEMLDKAKHETGGFDANDKIRVCQAMMSHDVSQPFGGSMAAAAAAVHAKALIIVSMRDHVVSPGPAIDFAQRIHARLLKIQSENGHSAAGSEEDGPSIDHEIHRFLKP